MWKASSFWPKDDLDKKALWLTKPKNSCAKPLAAAPDGAQELVSA
jgi:hypothetical protein